MQKQTVVSWEDTELLRESEDGCAWRIGQVADVWVHRSGRVGLLLIPVGKGAWQEVAWYRTPDGQLYTELPVDGVYKDAVLIAVLRTERVRWSSPARG